MFELIWIDSNPNWYADVMTRIQLDPNPKWFDFNLTRIDPIQIYLNPNLSKLSGLIVMKLFGLFDKKHFFSSHTFDFHKSLFW